MPEPLDLTSLAASAARAAGIGDVPAAADLLRQLLRRQRVTLGPSHPDIATTLNNLALMLEQLGQMDEAGRCYERAFAIAAAALDPDDPLLQVSRANLQAFVAAHGPVATDDHGAHGTLDDFPASPGAAGAVPPAGAQARTPPREPAPVPRPRATAAAAAAPAARPASPPLPPAAPAPQAAPTPARSPSGSRGLGIAALIGVLGVAGLWLAWPSEPAPAAAPPERRAAGPTTGEPPRAGTPPTAAAEDPGQTTRPEPAAPATQSPAPSPQPRETPTVPPPGAPTSSPSDAARPQLSAVESGLCRSLDRSRGAWTCAPLPATGRPGVVIYYTRVRTPRGAVVRHRWTRDGTVERMVDLRIGANATDGYRTFSRRTMGPKDTGEWAVELLAPGGAVLDTQRFSVP